MDQSRRTKPSPPPDEGTAGSLVAAALEIFGKKGFEATSTREIAAAAKTNVASIAYHFSGKDGLRLACAQSFATRLGALIEGILCHSPETPAEAEAMLTRLVEQMARHLIAEPAMQPLTAFALREISDNGPGVAVIYDSLIGPAHRKFCTIWAMATGEAADQDAVKLMVFSMIGQILYFRIGAPIVSRRMGWASITATETEQIVQTLRHNLRALLAARRGDPA